MWGSAERSIQQTTHLVYAKSLARLAGSGNPREISRSWCKDGDDARKVTPRRFESNCIHPSSVVVWDGPSALGVHESASRRGGTRDSRYTGLRTRDSSEIICLRETVHLSSCVEWIGGSRGYFWDQNRAVLVSNMSTGLQLSRGASAHGWRQCRKRVSSRIYD